MSKARLILATVTLVFLTGGYVASQVIYKMGDPAAYVHALDKSAVVYLSLGLLIGAVVFAFMPGSIQDSPVEGQAEPVQ